jgi:hypothetical protein
MPEKNEGQTRYQDYWSTQMNDPEFRRVYEEVDKAEGLAQYRQKRIQAETQAWYRLPAEVRNQYRGRYVAMYNCKIVDSDSDRLALYTRMRHCFAGQPVLVIEGGDQPMPVYSVRSALHS